jgi:hypothetical protein
VEVARERRRLAYRAASPVLAEGRAGAAPEAGSADPSTARMLRLATHA